MESTDPKLCSHCDKELDTTGYPRWCKACRAAYQREYQSLKKEISESRGFQMGAAAARNHFAEKFQQLANVQFNGATAAEWVRTEPIPK